MFKKTKAQAPDYDRFALYEKWNNAADAISGAISGAVSIGASMYGSTDRARAYRDGAARIHINDNIAAYLAKRISSVRTSVYARETYADMLNDVHVSSDEVADLRASVERLEAENAALRAEVGDTEDSPR